MKETMLKVIRESGKKVFLVENNSLYTYKELLDMTYVFCKAIYDNGYRKILIALPQGFYAYSMILAAYFSNATFCIINTDLPEERKVFIARQFNPDIVVFKNDEFWNYFDIPKKNIDNLSEGVANDNVNRGDIQCFNNNTIYVSFTSGSTGKPKGCAIKRAAVERIVPWAVRKFGLDSNTVWAQYTPLYFDMSLIDIFGSVYIGARLITFSDIIKKLRPGSLIRQHKITFLNIVPQVIDIMIKSGQLNYEICKSVRTIRFGGDKVYKRTLDDIFEILPEVKVISTYGPTETTFFCTYKVVDKSCYEKYCTNILTIGAPIPGSSINLIDVDNGIGEIIISGENVGFGYIGKEQLGYKRISINDKECIVYHTGDYATKVDENYFFYGRKDLQIKISGQRFNLIEIEYALKEINCSDCVAVLKNNDIVCYIVDKEESIETECLNEKIKNMIPDVFLPKYYIKINEIPYNANGKIDRKRLFDEVGEYLCTMK